MNRIRTELLADETQRFHDLIAAYPRCAPFWDLEKRDLAVSKLNAAIPAMAHGEQIMAQFFISLWTGLNDGRFDMFDAAATLDDKERMVITKWLADPFWP
ncbi:hypothetical protein ACILPN_22715 (plasmid) [Yersinia wautersii]|uniref:Uncharacterized protein n=1 Tax=Yersinia pseudotuberculosis TaxID=633 RepID=A0A380SBH6_YERPU|nr:hypothetical protein [Yersinia pseudotuberculosis]SUQ39504.1 Uncharacterised protein [Yersinia pseudotuberculosis]